MVLSGICSILLINYLVSIVMKECGDCANKEGCQSCGDKLTWRQFLMCFVGAIVAVILLMILTTKSEVSATSGIPNCLSREQVATADKDRKLCLTIFGGGVYDFTVAKRWDLSGHVGKHLCGKEYSKETIEEGPHKLAVIDKFFYTKVCGATSETIPVGKPILPTTILGMSWFRFSAYVSLIFFVLNFATCFAMPWAKLPEPWKGNRPGRDKNDALGRFPLSHMHKIWAWLAIFTLSAHGLLGFVGIFLGKWY